MFTHIDPTKTRVIKRWGKRVTGFAYQQAGWEVIGKTSSGLITLAKLNSPLARRGDTWQPGDPDLTYRPEDYWPNRPNTGDQWDPTAGGTPHTKTQLTKKQNKCATIKNATALVAKLEEKQT